MGISGLRPGQAEWQVWQAWQAWQAWQVRPSGAGGLCLCDGFCAAASSLTLSCKCEPTGVRVCQFYGSLRVPRKEFIAEFTLSVLNDLKKI